MLSDDIQKHSRFSDELVKIRRKRRMGPVGHLIRRNTARGENEHIARIMGDNTFIKPREIKSLQSKHNTRVMTAASIGPTLAFGLGSLGAGLGWAGTSVLGGTPLGETVLAGGRSIAGAANTVRPLSVWTGLGRLQKGFRILGRIGKNVTVGES